MAERRYLDLRSLDDVIAEVVRLRDGGYTALGKWNLSQMGDHLSETIRVGIDGDEKRLPWIMRKVAWHVLARARRTRRMLNGAPTVPRLIPEPLEADDPAMIAKLIASLEEARDFPGPLPPYVLCDGLSLEQWKDLMVVHSQHHLGFLIPNEA